MKYAGVPTDRISASSTTSSGRSTPRWPAATGRPLYALPTYTALLELRELLVRRGLPRGSWAR